MSNRKTRARHGQPFTPPIGAPAIAGPFGLPFTLDPPADPMAADPPADRTPGGLPVLLSGRDICVLFNRSERTVRRWITLGHLTPIHVGRARFFHPDDVRRLLGEGR